MNTSSIQDQEIIYHITLGRQSNDSKNGITTESLIHDQGQLLRSVPLCIREVCVGIFFFIVGQKNPAWISANLRHLTWVRERIALPYQRRQPIRDFHTLEHLQIAS